MAGPRFVSAASRAAATTTPQAAALLKPQHRRAVLAGLVALPVLQLATSASPALAKDFKAAQAEKEARKKALREAAGEIKSTGVDVTQVFDMPEYSVSEEARTPNVHSRQGEGARSQKNI